MKIKNNMFNQKNVIEYLILLMVSVLFLVIGILIKKYNYALTGTIILLITSIYYCIKNFKNKFYLLFFDIVIFVFLLARPTISMIKSNKWWYFNHESISWSLISIFISILFLSIGSRLYDLINNNKSNVSSLILKNNIFTKNIDLIRRISFVLLIITLFSSFLIEFEKLIVMHGRSYEDYYINYVSNMPFIIKAFSSMFMTFFVIYLLTRPNIKFSYIFLILYVILQIPMLIIGERGGFVKAILFCLVYLLYVNDFSKIKKLINFKTIIISVIVAFFGISALGIYNYTRGDQEIPSFNPIDIFTDFFYKQGTTYDVLNIGYNNLNKLPNRKNKNYTFGMIIDTFKYNMISQYIFKVKPINNTNSVEKATKTNDFAHALAYTARPSEYLNGHGMGSSYLLETYADYGYIGIIVYSILLGYFMSSITYILNRRNLFSIITLYSIKEIYVIPRSSALGFLSFLGRIGFWMPIIAIIFIIEIIRILKGRQVVNSTKRIAFINYDFSVFGGVEKVTEGLANDLSKFYQIYIISLYKENKIIPYNINSNIKTYFLNDSKAGRLRNTIKDNYGKIRKILKENNIDIALCMGHYACFASVFNKMLIDTKFIFCDHGALINQWSDKGTRLIRRIDSIFTDYTVVLTDRSRNDYIKLFHFNKNKISRIYNFISNDVLDEYKDNIYNLKSKKIITVGRLSSEKGLDLLIEIAKELKKLNNDWSWDIYGDGELMDIIKSEIINNKLTKHVFLKGADKNVMKKYNNYGIYALTSYREGLPLVLLEAKINKLPIVSFDIETGPNEIVKDNVNGFLVVKYNTKLFAKKLNELLNNSKLRKEFSDNAYKDISKFREDEIINEWVTLINRLLEEK